MSRRRRLGEFVVEFSAVGSYGFLAWLTTLFVGTLTAGLLGADPSTSPLATVLPVGAFFVGVVVVGKNGGDVAEAAVSVVFGSAEDSTEGEEVSAS